MARVPRPYAASYSFGPGPLTPAVKALLILNVAVFLLEFVLPDLMVGWLGLRPAAVLERGWLWQPVTYMFLHHPGGFSHILFNMLALWMFGVDLERLWGTRFFVRYYLVTGVGAAVTTIIVALLPFDYGNLVYAVPTVGASGAIYGLLLAFAYYYPDRPILMFLLFPIPAKYFVMIIGAIAFLSSTQGMSNTAHATHLGGLLAGYLYLKSGRGGLVAEIKYRWVKWKMNRLRRKFDVHTGGRDRWDRTVH
ncbi:MAG TPA: rhomboid family intramembrane serine protease [Vicinamibacterales bacterium]|nr:rhomboid family intramembrane serine protease [Vicinamibacterales bacterium]